MTFPVRQAISASEARHFDTDNLRSNFLISGIFKPGEVSLIYSHLDRTIVGGAMPGAEILVLKSSKPVGSDPFLQRREMGVINIGGAGEIVLDGKSFLLNSSDCLYVPKGVADVQFKSADAGKPAKFYLVSTPAHQAFPARLITVDQANSLNLGSDAECNKRVLQQYIHPDIVETCQLLMGITRLAPGNVWNTMPCHTHDRRTEVYLYFDMAAETRVFHLMGEPDETRHLIVGNEEAILSPGWSIHSGAGTSNYSFIWSMAGDNQDFTDMDFVATTDLR